MAEVEESKKLESESPSDPPPAPVEKEKPLVENPKDPVSHKDKSEIPQPPPLESKPSLMSLKLLLLLLTIFRNLLPKRKRETEAPPPSQNPVDHDDQMVDDDPSSTILDLTSSRFHDLDSVELSPSLIELDLTTNCLTGLDSRIATLANLKKLYLRQNLIRFADSGDVLFIHYSGHGTCLLAEIGNDDDTGYDECIVPTDMNLIAELLGSR
ncbi:hypothetical protein C1H46_003083 [Malus baccata]|uniref:Peptidase C14 caspase domain-containing protein n=1 Tax=Malus baccata TaxID=106549 RepID=A0A540NJY9_MALBA|nr:hypothetical protein C1H46_003083 [Malus baccata]